MLPRRLVFDVLSFSRLRLAVYTHLPCKKRESYIDALNVSFFKRKFEFLFTGALLLLTRVRYDSVAGLADLKTRAHQTEKLL